jgi:predicted PurR-regulated permease PerM
MARLELKLPLIVRASFILLFFILVFYILIEFKFYLTPLILGVLFAYLLYPIANFLEKNNFPRILANIVSIIVGIAIVYGIGFFIYKQFRVFLTDLPALKQQAVANISELFNSIEKSFDIETGELKQEFSKLIQTLFESPGQTFQGAFGATFNTLFSVLIMPVYVFFLLYYRDKFRNFLLMLVPDGKTSVAVRIIDEVNRVTIRYMTGVTIVVIILFFVNSTGFLIIGLDYAIFLGAIAAIMNFIPYYGTIIGYSFPFFFAFFVMDSPQYAFWVFIQFIIVQFTENNILTPNIVGSHVNINPFMIILAITMGGFVWGVPGMFIAVPVVTVMRVLGENIDELSPLGFLLGQGGTEEHSLSKHKIQRYFRISKMAAKRRLRNRKKGQFSS